MKDIDEIELIDLKDVNLEDYLDDIDKISS